MIVNKIVSRISFRGSKFLVKNNRFVRFNSSNTKDIVLQKYRDKLNEKANALGLKDVDDLKEKLKDDIEKKKKEFSAIDPLKELEEYERRHSEK